MSGENIDILHLSKMSNAHLVHAVMPTLLAMIEAWPIREGVRVSGVEINGKDAAITIDGKIVGGLVKKFLSEIDEACVKCLSEAPSISTRPTTPTNTDTGEGPSRG